MVLAKTNKKALSFLAILLCMVMVVALLPSHFSEVYAADYYYNALVEYQFNSANKGYYFVPKAPGKYPVIIMVHGQGGMANMKPHMLAFMNDWVKAGYFEPAVVVLPQIDNYDGIHQAARDIIDFQNFVDNNGRLKLLLTNIKNGTLTAKADPDRPISIAGYSMGGYCALYAASKFHELLKCGCLSPSASFYLGEDKWGSYNHAADIHMSTDPDAKILLICGAGEADTPTYNGYEESIDRYIGAINVNNTNPDLMTKYLCPADWNGHGWYLFQREIFMWMFLNKNGVLPSVEQVNKACNYRMPTTPDVVKQEVNLDNVTLPGKLIELAISGFTKDTATNPATAAGSIGNIANNGSRGTSTRVVMSGYDTSNSQNIELKAFETSGGGSTNYLHYSKNADLVQKDNNSRFVEDSILESQGNTISFWAKVVPGQERRNILNYRVSYGGTASNVLRLCSESSATTLNLCNGWDSNVRANIDDTNGKWAHYVITNPAYSGGSKTVGVYVDGSLIFEKTIEKPTGNLDWARLYFAGENEGNHTIFYPDSFDISGISVYDTVLSQYQIYKANETELPDYSETGEPAAVLGDILGYTFSSSTIAYDGQNHMLSVTKGANATEDVTITYTSDGAPFEGAAEEGTYPVTATITKEGFRTLILYATLKIKPEGADEVLIDLDMSTYQKDTSSTDPNMVSGSIGGIENGGILADTTVIKMSSQSGRWTYLDLSKETFQNDAGGTTSYIHRTLDTSKDSNIYMCSDINRHSIIIENGLEKQANTITFWANHVPVNRESVEYNILDYNVKYDTEENPSHMLTLNQGPTTTGKFTLVGRGQEIIYGDITDEAAGQWAQYVVTNPSYVNGEKTMKVYVNGKYLGEKKVVQPQGAVESVKLCFGGEGAPAAPGYFWPTDISLGEIKVYDGELGDDEIAALYDGSKARYTEAGASSLENITGYTFENATVSYDGENHTIEVTKAEGATEGVDIAYTINGAAFTGASEVGKYSVRATLTKAGFKNLTLTATLTIDPAEVIPVDDGEVLIDLDLTSFAPSKTAGASGIVNKGTSKTATIEAYSSDEVALTTDYIYDKNDFGTSKKVVRLTHGDLGTILSGKKLQKHFELSDPAIEAQDVTLSFWTNIDPVSKQTSASAFSAIAQYNAKRDDGTFRNQADGTNSRARLWQYSLDTSPYYYWGNAWGYEIAPDNSKQWHHVVMTIPKFSGGAKEVNIYVDGALGLTQNVNLGGHALSESFISFGSDENKAYVSTDISFADIKVYAGAMSEEGIQNLYDSEKDFYDSIAYNKITVSKDGTINKLSDLTAGDTVTISYDENTENGAAVYAAILDANGKLLNMGTAFASGSGSFNLTIPEGFEKLNVYTWGGRSGKSIQKVYTLIK